MKKYTRNINSDSANFVFGGIKRIAGNIGSKLGGAVNTIGALSTPLFLAPMFVPGADTQLQAKIQEGRLKEQENEFRLQGIEPPSAAPTPVTRTNQNNVRTTNMNPELVQRPPMRQNSMR